MNLNDSLSMSLSWSLLIRQVKINFPEPNSKLIEIQKPIVQHKSEKALEEPSQKCQKLSKSLSTSDPSIIKNTRSKYILGYTE